jgi:hypothetical protein
MWSLDERGEDVYNKRGLYGWRSRVYMDGVPGCIWMAFPVQEKTFRRRSGIARMARARLKGSVEI